MTLALAVVNCHFASTARSSRSSSQAETSPRSASYSQSWSPDALGNFTNVTTNGTGQTRTANQQNEITSIQGAGSVTYDADGNLTADGSGNTYVYDAWNRLVAVKSGSTTLAAYGYDGLGRRVQETHGTTTRDVYFSSSGQVLEERIGTNVDAQNVWSPVYVNALVVRDQSSLHNGTLDQRLYAQADNNWDVTGLLNTSGTVVERYAYTAYGAVSYLSASWGSLGSSAYAATYLFQGGRIDVATGNYVFERRDYSPSLMRWLQTDPLGLKPDVNDYRFVSDNGIKSIDPTGTQDPSIPRYRLMPPAHDEPVLKMPPALDTLVTNNIFWGITYSNPAGVDDFMNKVFGEWAQRAGPNGELSTSSLGQAVLKGSMKEFNIKWGFKNAKDYASHWGQNGDLNTSRQ